ncbi:hypothetical protein BKA67DRAFT_662935 [Truncatella angustata]|uniref:Uncharacterized protein n=1 Tax=Truncatella angustata TaxID=152316 RepID=A0A9P8UCQ3_9PEZI|nr:uncharacterized protein BKA67DRAFT_662935 [Truncatella angustata]KAH6646520.1 hypothetical protein BKA67DRAFT_662935 [Truncatella angustata]
MSTDTAAVKCLTVATSHISQIAQDLAEIRASLKRLEAELFYRSIPWASPIPSSGIKRGGDNCLESSSKRQRTGHEVNIRATRAWLKINDETHEYVMEPKRGKRKQRWKSTFISQKEEVDGEYLLTFSDVLSIEIRANADWLPIRVTWNDESGLFEGTEGINGKTLQVTDVVMINVMGGVGNSYIAYII